MALDGRALPRALGDAVTFARIDDGFFDHPKVLRAGEDAANLYVRALVWCNKHLTDGAIPREALRALTGRRDAPSLADCLVAVGLWETTAEGWSVHDFLCFNAQRKDVLAQRAELSRKRAEAGKQGGLRSGEVRKTKQVASTLLPTDEANGKPHPIPSNPIPEGKEESPLPPAQAKPAAGGETSPTGDTPSGVDRAQPQQGTQQPRKRRERVAPPPDTIPLAGTPARGLYDALVNDPVLRPIVTGPGDFAARVTDPAAFPGVDVLAEVKRAGLYASEHPGRYSDGRRFLTGWLARRAAEVSRAPRPAAPPPIATLRPERQLFDPATHAARRDAAAAAARATLGGPFDHKA